MNGLEYQIALLEEALASLDVRYHSLSDVVVSDLLRTLANTTAVVRVIADEQRKRIQSPAKSPRALLGTHPLEPGTSSRPTSSASSSPTRLGGNRANPFNDAPRGSETLASISAQLDIPLHRIRELNPHMAAVAAEDVLPPNTFVKLPREAMHTPLRERRASLARRPTPSAHDNKVPLLVSAPASPPAHPSHSPSSSPGPALHRTSLAPSDRTPTQPRLDFTETEAEVQALSRGLRSAAGRAAADPGEAQMLWTPASVRSPPPANAPAPLPPPPPYRPNTAAGTSSHPTESEMETQATETQKVDFHKVEPCQKEEDQQKADANRPSDRARSASRRESAVAEVPARASSSASSVTLITTRGGSSCSRSRSRSQSLSKACTHSSTTRRSSSTGAAQPHGESDAPCPSSESETPPHHLPPRGLSASASASPVTAVSPRLREALDNEAVDDHIVAAAEEEALWSPEGPARRRAASDPRHSARQDDTSPIDSTEASPLPTSTAHRRDGQMTAPASVVPSTLAYFYQHAPPPTLEAPRTQSRTDATSLGMAIPPPPTGTTTTTLTSTRPLRPTAPRTSASALPKNATARALQSLGTSPSAGLSATSSPRRSSSPLQLRNLQPRLASPPRRASPPTTATALPTSAATGASPGTSPLRAVGPFPSVSSVSSSSSPGTGASPSLPAPPPLPPTRVASSSSPPASERARTTPSLDRVRPTAGPSISPHRSPTSPRSPLGFAGAEQELLLLPATSPGPHPPSAAPATTTTLATSAPTSASAAASPIAARGFTLPAREELERAGSSSSTPARWTATSEERLPRAQALMHASDAELDGSPAPASAALRPRSHSREEAPEEMDAAGTGDSEDGGGSFDTLRTISAAYGVPIEDILLYNDFLCAYDMDEPLPADLPITLPVVGDEEEAEMDL